MACEQLSTVSGGDVVAEPEAETEDLPRQIWQVATVWSRYPGPFHIASPFPSIWPERGPRHESIPTPDPEEKRATHLLHQTLHHSSGSSVWLARPSLIHSHPPMLPARPQILSMLMVSEFVNAMKLDHEIVLLNKRTGCQWDGSTTSGPSIYQSLSYQRSPTHDIETIYRNCSPQIISTLASLVQSSWGG